MRPPGLFDISMILFHEISDRHRLSPLIGRVRGCLFLGFMIICFKLLMLFPETIIINGKQSIIKSERDLSIIIQIC